MSDWQFGDTYKAGDGHVAVVVGYDQTWPLMMTLVPSAAWGSDSFLAEFYAVGNVWAWTLVGRRKNGTFYWTKIDEDA